MKYLLIIMIVICIITSIESEENMKYKELTPKEKEVIENKGTERPFTGKYNDHYEKGTYHCKRCGAALYRSTSKFKSGCGWPSFDDEMEGAVERKPDADGIRTEILCKNCGAHLGHVFTGENYTDKNTRHCVNSISLTFVLDKQKAKLAYFAAGCFWGVEHYFKKLEGVLETDVGYIGGKVDNPTYEIVSSGSTDYKEAIEVKYNPDSLDYEDLVKYFFEIHDFTQKNGQGPDIGEQYKSFIFYHDDKEKRTAEKVIELLKQKGYKVATQLQQATKFFQAEKYHQDYYKKTGKTPYCHTYRKIFDKEEKK